MTTLQTWTTTCFDRNGQLITNSLGEAVSVDVVFVYCV